MMDGEERACEGPDSMYVKLISSDDHEFIVKREHALVSGTIKAMLSGPGAVGCCRILPPGFGCSHGSDQQEIPAVAVNTSGYHLPQLSAGFTTLPLLLPESQRIGC
ncbi:uncharacterized protein LOC114459718 isoform X2 [Gouania willdenowi]|uniref:uncharacterized protein LOC114459718 isoform X2 n=1 Tax=Gouania willdenowi TaxID=441366 RepID=UPI001056624D|nr:uncharacterized protein LOC114459718 isoform X2 [Gouania willdenowi]